MKGRIDENIQRKGLWSFELGILLHYLGREKQNAMKPNGNGNLVGFCDFFPGVSYS